MDIIWLDIHPFHMLFSKIKLLMEYHWYWWSISKWKVLQIWHSPFKILCDSNRWKYLNNYITEECHSNWHISKENQTRIINTIISQNYQGGIIVIESKIWVVIDVAPDEVIWTFNRLYYLNYEPISRTSSTRHLVCTRNVLGQTVSSYGWRNGIPRFVPFFRLFSERYQR